MKCPPQAPRPAAGRGRHPPPTGWGEYPRPKSSPCHEHASVSWCPVRSDTQKRWERGRVSRCDQPGSSLHPYVSSTAMQRQAARQSERRSTCKGQCPGRAPSSTPPSPSLPRRPRATAVRGGSSSSQSARPRRHLPAAPLGGPLHPLSTPTATATSDRQPRAGGTAPATRAHHRGLVPRLCPAGNPFPPPCSSPDAQAQRAWPRGMSGALAVCHQRRQRLGRRSGGI